MVFVPSQKTNCPGLRQHPRQGPCSAGHLLASLQKGRILCVAAKKRLFAMSGLGNVSLQVIKTKIALVRIHISHHKRKKKT